TPRALPSRWQLEDCTCRAKCKNSYLSVSYRKFGGLGAGKNIRFARRPGKSFRPGGPEKVSVNHTDLPSILGAQGGLAAMFCQRGDACRPAERREVGSFYGS